MLWPVHARRRHRSTRSSPGRRRDRRRGCGSVHRLAQRRWPTEAAPTRRRQPRRSSVVQAAPRPRRTAQQRRPRRSAAPAQRRSPAGVMRARAPSGRSRDVRRHLGPGWWLGRSRSVADRLPYRGRSARRHDAVGPVDEVRLRERSPVTRPAGARQRTSGGHGNRRDPRARRLAPPRLPDPMRSAVTRSDGVIQWFEDSATDDGFVAACCFAGDGSRARPAARGGITPAGFQTIRLIQSRIYASQAVLEATASVLTHECSKALRASVLRGSAGG